MTDASVQFRVEHDSLGLVQVPADRLWGAQTQRSLEHFAIGAEKMPPALVPAFAHIKRAAAIVNGASGALAADRRDAIVAVCDELLAGAHAAMFPLHVWMSGSGTQFNMNVNEVIANRASQMAGQPLGSGVPLHPNDHVNLGQSSNDTFPSAIHVCAALEIRRALLPALTALAATIEAKAEGWRDVVKIGRTHLQDATPMTLGQEWSGYAAMLRDAAQRIDAAMPGVMQLALGGTAVGTGINAPAGFAEAVAAEIARATGLPFVTAPNKFAVQGAHDALVHLSSALRTLAVTLTKIANDLRFLASGPRAGIAELVLPANEPGSSIMPGKVNPTQIEAITMIAAQVMANDMAIGLGGAGGSLEMNAYKPLIVHNLMQSIVLLAGGMATFDRFCVAGIEPDRARIARNVERSLMLVTALVPLVGYEKAAAIALRASRENLTLREAALASGHVRAEDFDRIVRPERMT